MKYSLKDFVRKSSRGLREVKKEEGEGREEKGRARKLEVF